MVYLNIFTIITVLLFIFFIIGKLINNFLNTNYSLEEGIIIGFSLFIFLINVNFYYFNLNILLIIIVSLLIIIFFKRRILYNETKEFLKILYTSFILIFLSFILVYFYGLQFIIFRGNFYDYFSYLSTASIISNYSFNEIKDIINNDNDNLFLSYGQFIFSRPSSQILISTINTNTLLNIFYSGFTFKIICIILAQISSYALFFEIIKNKNKSLILSFGFIFSFFYFYIYEIDALSNLLAIPVLLIIIKNTPRFVESLLKNHIAESVVYCFLFSILVIIYPEIALVFSIPLGFYIINNLIKKKFFKKLNILILFLCFITVFLIILPLYNSTIEYLINNQIRGGLNSKVDYWGYYGAFILGKDNPIYDESIVNQVKHLWSEKFTFSKLLKFIHITNLELNNNFYYLNIVPSILGFFHLTTDNKLKLFDNFLLFPLFIFNIYLVLRVFKNLRKLILSKNQFMQLLKFFIIFYFIFSIYLLLNFQIWSLIKLFSFFGILIFILVSMNIGEKKIGINNILIVILAALPFYKYSEFNNGIGKLDSFPSIMKPELKNNIEWAIKYEDYSNCSKFESNFYDKVKYIYISLIFNEFNNKNNNDNTCKVIFKNKNFIISNLND